MIIKLFLFWRFGLFLVAYLGTMALPKIANGALGSGPIGFNYWTAWVQWDGGHYFDIVTKGYLDLIDYAFFPLYPSLVKITGFFVGNIILSGLIISNTAFLFFLIVLFKYCRKKYGTKIALNTAVTYLFFPTAFFAVSFYSESLFLLIAVLFFLQLEKRNYLLAGLFASAASLTRLVGVTLIISLFYSYFVQINFEVRKINKKTIHLAISLFGFLCYAIYLWYKLNNPLIFLTSQTIWNRSVTDPISTIVSYFWALIIGQPRPINDYFDLLVTVVFVGILAAGIKKIPSSLWIFSVLVILIPASSGTLTSMPRYALSSIGVFIIAGKYLEEKPALKIPLWAFMLTAQTYLVVRFLTGHWVA